MEKHPQILAEILARIQMDALNLEQNSTPDIVNIALPSNRLLLGVPWKSKPWPPDLSDL